MREDKLYELFIESQNNYVLTKTKKYLKDNSQFFTSKEIAYKMLSTIDFTCIKSLDEITILEPAAGCGILILAIVLFIIKNTKIKSIKIDAYEIDEDLARILRKNLLKLKKYIKHNTDISLVTRVFNDNFILKNKNKWERKYIKNTYNIIISNPPFKKINKVSPEAKALKNIVFGQPNIYTLFIALSLKLLDHNGIYTVVSPRSYLIGTYNEKLRKYAFTNYTLRSIYSFDNRNMFKFANQEIIISSFINNKLVNYIDIYHNDKFKYKTNIKQIIYDKERYSLIVPKNHYDIELINKLHKFKYTLGDLGVNVSVGPIVQFRNEKYLSSQVYKNNYVPMIISKDIIENDIVYFDRKNTRKTHNKSINNEAKNLIKNSNYLLLRKVTAKDDKETIISAVLRKNYFNCELLGVDNNLLYFHSKNHEGELSIEECYGLFCYINSNYFKQLYSLINGNHTINVSDFNNIKFPDLYSIKQMGKTLLSINRFDKNICSDVLSKYFY